MATIEPFQIAVSDSQLQRLKTKLELTTFPNEFDDASWEYGSLPADVKRIATFWRDKYDWRKAEAKLNELPHFKTKIHYDDAKFDPIDLHFIYHKSEVKGAIPLLFVHGCKCPPQTNLNYDSLIQSTQGQEAFLKLPRYFLCSPIAKETGVPLSTL